MELQMEFREAKQEARILRCDAYAAEVAKERREAGSDAAACWTLRKRLLGQQTEARPGLDSGSRRSNLGRTSASTQAAKYRLSTATTR